MYLRAHTINFLGNPFVIIALDPNLASITHEPRMRSDHNVSCVDPSYVFATLANFLASSHPFRACFRARFIGHVSARTCS